MGDPTQSEVWKALEQHAQQLRTVHLRELFAADPARAERLSFDACGLHADLSKHRIDSDTLALLLELARVRDVEGWRERMFRGERINTTENRPALHIALRNRSRTPILVDGEDVMPAVEAVLARMQTFAEGVRDGTIRGASGERFTDIVHIGIGGSELGPRTVCEAMRPYARPDLRIHFAANVDPADLGLTLAGLDPARTLVLVASKTFSTQETMLNARAARAWLAARLGEAAVRQHFVAISTHRERVAAFGIDPANMFEFWDWVGGRYSLWSAVGLPIVLYAGFECFARLLDGAHAMDRHFREAPAERNLPLLTGLLGVWYTDFLGAESTAIVPYDETLRFLPMHLQQLDMESNGKSVRRDGAPVSFPTGPIVWGTTGTNGQHAYFQLLHQGTRLVPLDILVAARSRLAETDERHAVLVANALAQSRALAFGRTADEARAELAAEGLTGKALEDLLPHRVFPGNRPSSVIVCDRLTPERLGALLALYEHRVFVQGVIWGINSFDQWGVELGKKMAGELLPGIAWDNAVPALDPSTAALVGRVREWRRAAQK